MTDKETIKASKFLSLILRHDPGKVGITLDEAGWVGVEELLKAIGRSGNPLSLEQLRNIVATSEKKRFAFSEDGFRIRASQGHSVEVDLQYTPQTPPEILYHGTAARSLEAIRKEGLQRMGRHDVHLQTDPEAALKVGGRHGKPVLLKVRSGDMHRAGFEFKVSANGVWLTEQVPVEFIQFPKSGH